MALLFVDSFDHYQTADIDRKWSSSDTAVIQSGGRCGTQCLKLTESHSATRGVSASGTTFIAGMAIKHTSSGGSNPIIWQLRCANTPIINMFHAADGSLYATLNPDAAFPSISFISGGGILPFDEWHYVEFKIVLNGSSSGSVDIQVDGNLVYSTSGIATIYSGDPAQWTGLSLVSGLFGTTIYYDDFYLADGTGSAPWNDFLGDVRIEYLRPTANGTNQDWTLAAGADHWDAVDDGANPDDDTSYITGDTVGQIETDVFEDSALPVGSEVFGVQMSFLAKKDNPSNRLIAPAVYHSAVTYNGNNVAITLDDYNYSIVMMEENPGTSAQWTVSDVNNDELGVEVTN